VSFARALGGDARVSRLSGLPRAALGQLLQRHAAILARLARGHAQFQQLPVGEQNSGCYPPPTPLLQSKWALRHRVRTALGEALGAGGSPYRIGCLLNQQRLIAMQGTEAFEATLQMLPKLAGGDSH
jgi:hypothetical protein